MTVETEAANTPRLCEKCAAPVGPKVAHGYCRTHAHFAIPRASCRTCGVTLGRFNTSGHCRAHATAQIVVRPEYKAAQAAGVARYYSDPEHRAKARAVLAINRHKGNATAKRSEAAKKARIWEKGNAAQPKGSEPRQRAAQSISATKMAWCPVRYRDDYRRLIRSLRYSKAEAQLMIADMVERDLEQWRASVGIPVGGIGEPVGDEARFVADVRSRAVLQDDNAAMVPEHVPVAAPVQSAPITMASFIAAGSVNLPRVQLMRPVQMGRAAA